MGNLTLEWHDGTTYTGQVLIDTANQRTQGMMSRRFPVAGEALRFFEHSVLDMLPLGGRAVLRGDGSSPTWTSPNEIAMLERVEITAGSTTQKTTQVVPPTAARLFGRTKIEFYQNPPSGAKIRITALVLPKAPATVAEVVNFPYAGLWVDYAITEMYRQSQEQGPLSDEIELTSLYAFWKASADQQRDAILLTLGYTQQPQQSGSGGGGGRSSGGGGGGGRR